MIAVTQVTRDHCIVRHSLRYSRHSGPVIYISKLPRPQSQCLAITAFCKAPQKNKFYLFLLRPLGGLNKNKEHSNLALKTKRQQLVIRITNCYLFLIIFKGQLKLLHHTALTALSEENTSKSEE